MSATSLRLVVSASNIANTSTTGPLPDANTSSGTGHPSAYSPLRVDQIDVGGRTAATVTTVSPNYVPMYDPSAPYADKSGMVAAPNIDLANEAVQQIIASYTFAANVTVMTIDSQMTSMLLNMAA